MLLLGLGSEQQRLRIRQNLRGGTQARKVQSHKMPSLFDYCS